MPYPGILAPFKYSALPLGSIKPLGWIKDQIQLSADGLAGHEWYFYRYVRHTTWMKGHWEYSGLRESATYWFNYIVPLAFTLDDARLKKQAKEFLDTVLDNQHRDGWLGPEVRPQERGLWARSFLLFGMNYYAEAEPAETDRIVTAIHRFVNLAADMLRNNYTGLINPPDNQFSSGAHVLTRAHELVTAMQWLYEKHPRGNERNIWTVMELMFQGAIKGDRDWSKFFVKGVFPEQGMPNIHDRRFIHGVDVAEALRWTTVRYRLNKDEALAKQAETAHDLVFTHHGASSGSITSDEHLAGLGANRGSELCIAVEVMFSASYLYQFHGLNKFADRAERVAFNAMPAQISEDWWSRQYIALPNQPWAKKTRGRPYTNVGNNGTVFGLETNYPCCTVNFAHGYPKFVATSWLRKGKNGLVHALLSPSRVETTLENGNSVSVTAHTIYPFNTTIKYIISAQKPFDFYIRIPEWSVLANSSIQTDNLAATSVLPNEDNLQHVKTPAGITTVIIMFGQKISVEPRDNSAVAISRGPLLYALDLEYYTENFKSRQYFNDSQTLPDDQLYLPYTMDHYIHPHPAAIWKIAIDPSDISVTEPSRPSSMELPNPIFARGAPPVALEVAAVPIEWGVIDDILEKPPRKPVATGKPFRAKFVPYGAAKIRMTELPVVDLKEWILQEEGWEMVRCPEDDRGDESEGN